GLRVGAAALLKRSALQRPDSRDKDAGCSWLEECQSLCNKLVVILEYAAVSGVTIEDELGMWQTSRQVGRITAGHHAIVLTVDDQDRLLNAGQVGRFLTPPRMDGLELSTERAEGHRSIAIVRPFLQSLHE